MSSYNEQLGAEIKDIFTVPWTYALAAKIYRDTGDPKIKLSWFLKSLGYGYGGLNTDLMLKLKKLSGDTLLPGADRVLYMKANANVNEAFVRSFLAHMNDDDVKDVPTTVGKAGDTMEQILSAIGGLAGGLSKTGNTIPAVLIILAVGVGGYLIFSGRKGVNFIPSMKL